MICEQCKGKKQIWVKDGVVQGQDYGPHEEGHYETCAACNGKGEINNGSVEITILFSKEEIEGLQELQSHLNCSTLEATIKRVIETWGISDY